MSQSKKRCIVIDVVTPIINKDEAQKNLAEMLSLIDTYQGGEVIQVIQRRAHPHPGTYVGTGKAEEVAEIIKKEKIDVVILNTIAQTSQLYRLQQLFWKNNPNIEVWDRVDLILHIFDKHARTAEAKLQIELARMRHMGPRMYGLSGQLGRQGGGIGTRGLGETNVELMKRHWRDQMKKTSDKLNLMLKTRENQLQRRREIGYKTVSIVGYTNAGKTTLFNDLTKKNKLTKNVLFATLDSATGNLYLPHTDKKILISDTIGFIQNLPSELVDAFKSTLMESIHADLLLHVIDVSDPTMYQKIKTVEQILIDLGIEKKPIHYVFNKIEQMHPDFQKELTQHFQEFHPQFISAINGDGIDELKKIIAET